MPRIAIDYSKTIIYKIVCNDLTITETYVGHTINFTKRKCEHKRVCNNEADKHHHYKIYQTIRANGGWDNWSMLEICKYPCASNEEARAEERRFYEILNASLNMVIPYRSEEEDRNIRIERKRKARATADKVSVKQYRDKYYADNRDTILEKAKQYNNKHKEQRKQYAIDTKDRRNELQRIRRAKRGDNLLLA